jgi:hypothetical protein
MGTARILEVCADFFTLISVIALLGLSACGDDETDGGAAPTASSTVTVTDESNSTASPKPTSSPAEAPSPQLQWPTADVTAPFGGQVPPVPTLVAIRVGAHPEGGYDRAAFEFEGSPGYQVGYRSEIFYDGSGAPVDLEGDAFIQVVFNPAQAHDDAGQSTLSSPPVQPVEVDFATLESYVLNGDFEGYVSVALGLDDKVGFNVEHLQMAKCHDVVYVDVARP